MDFRVLGSLEVSQDGRLLVLGGLKQRALLAMLLVADGDVVSRDRLVDGIWGERAPMTAAHTLEAYVSRLRKILAADGGRDLLGTRAPGYVLQVAQDRIDLARFRVAAGAGREALAAGEVRRARDLLRSALAEFRGEPLADLADIPFATLVRPQLEDMRLDAIEDLMDAELSNGGQPGLTLELASLTTAHPLRERLLGQYAVALYRAGRQADALDALRHGQERLRDELGLDAAQPLREVEQAILRHDTWLQPGVVPVGIRVDAIGTASIEEREDRSANLPPTPSRLAGGRRRALGLAVAGALVLSGLTAGVAIRRLGHDDHPAQLLAGRDSLTALDPDSGRLIDQVPLRTTPGAVVVAAGSRWVLDPGDDSVTRVEADGVRQVVDVGAQPSALAASHGSVWVANTLDGTVSRVDVHTDRVVQTIPVGNRPAGLAAAAGAVWVALSADQALVRIDSRTGRLTARVDLDGGPTDLALSAQHLWAVSPSNAAVFRVALDGRDVTRVAVGTGPTALTAAPGSVWVANTLDGTVSRIDADRAVVTRTFEVGSAPSALAMTARDLWVADGDHDVVRRVNPTSGRTTASVDTGGPVTGLAADGGTLWLAGQGRRTATEHRGGTLRLEGTVPRLDSIDPARSAMLFPPQLLGMTNDGLVTFAHTTGAAGTRVVPDLATSLPTVTDHGRVYRFQMRRGITYSTGQPVQPGDIRRAIERDFRLGSPGTTAFAAIVGADRCSTHSCDLSRGIVVDDSAGSVTFHLRRPDPALIYRLAAVDAFAVPTGTPMHEVGTQPVPATGPYRIVEVTPGRSLTLARNPRFHEWSSAAQPDGYPDKIVWRFGLDPQRAVTDVEDGTADWALYDPPFAPPSNRLRQLVTEYASQVHVNPLPLVEYFSLHTREPPFDDPLVRRAVDDAVDRRALVRLYGGRLLATPTCQILPPGIPGHHRYCPYSTGGARSRYTAPRINLARSLVARSGTAGMRVRVLTDPGFAPAHYLVEVLRQLGFRASLWEVGPQRFERLANDSRHHVQVSRGGWAADYPSASDFLTRFLSCSSYRPASVDNENDSQVCLRGADRTMARASLLQQTDSHAAAHLWAQVDQAMTDRAVWVPTVNLRSLDVVSNRVGDYMFHPQWGIMLDQLWLR